jgi:hypothetical protein
MAGTPWYGHDTQLTVRLGFTLFLLALLYAVFLAVLWRVTGSAVQARWPRSSSPIRG